MHLDGCGKIGRTGSQKPSAERHSATSKIRALGAMGNSYTKKPAPNLAAQNRTKFIALVEEHNEKLVRFLAARVGDEQEARDIAQEAYARLLGLDENKVVNFHRAYLYRTAANIAIDRQRAAKRRSYSSEKLIDAHENLASDDPLADRILLSREKLEKLKSAIAALPPKCRYAFLEYRVNNRSYAEIAHDLSVSESMVRKHILRALRHCKARMDEES